MKKKKVEETRFINVNKIAFRQRKPIFVVQKTIICNYSFEKEKNF